MDDVIHPLANWIDGRQPKMTRADFARKIEVSEGHLSLFLKGKRGLSLKSAVAVETVTAGEFRPADLLIEVAA